MTLKLIYKPNIGVIINELALNWGIKRETVRKMLNNAHKAHDHIVAQPGEFDVSQRRDIYNDFYYGRQFFFFLNYDDNSCLMEVEVHLGVDIIIDNVTLTFEKRLSDIIEELKSVSPSIIKLRDGDYFFKDLKITIADSKAMGGEGSDLSYFYCSANVDHLID